MLGRIKNAVKKPINTTKSNVKNIAEKITSKIKNPKQNSKIDFSKFELNKSITTFSKDKNKAVQIGDKTIYGVGESEKDKYAFQNKYGIKKEYLTTEELNFLKLYSGDGYSSLNEYYRNIAGVFNPLKRFKIKRKCSKAWDEAVKDSKYYMSFNQALNISNSIFSKGIRLEEDLVVVRRQETSMTNYADGDIYHSDSFLATSISGNLYEYGDHINFIVIPKGTKILYLEEITESVDEFELLLDKNIDLRLIKEESDLIKHWVML